MNEVKTPKKPLIYHGSNSPPLAAFRKKKLG